MDISSAHSRIQTYIPYWKFVTHVKILWTKEEKKHIEPNGSKWICLKNKICPNWLVYHHVSIRVSDTCLTPTLWGYFSRCSDTPKWTHGKVTAPTEYISYHTPISWTNPSAPPSYCWWTPHEIKSFHKKTKHPHHNL